MRYFYANPKGITNMRPTMKLSLEDLREEDEPPTEPRPDLVRVWARQMNNVKEVCAPSTAARCAGLSEGLCSH